LLIAVSLEPCRYCTWRVCDDNIGGVIWSVVHTNATVFVVYFIDLYIPLLQRRRRRRRK
jgi:hypothetical protein